MTEARVCERLAHSPYTEMEGPVVELTTALS